MQFMLYSMMQFCCAPCVVFRCDKTVVNHMLWLLINAIDFTVEGLWTCVWQLLLFKLLLSFWFHFCLCFLCSLGLGFLFFLSSWYVVGFESSWLYVWVIFQFYSSMEKFLVLMKILLLLSISKAWGASEPSKCLLSLLPFPSGLLWIS